jgi:outer membrane lipoprotein LolB
LIERQRLVRNFSSSHLNGLRDVALAALCLLTFAGCAMQPQRAPGAAIPLEALDRWEARGRIGVSGPDGGGSGSFDWEQKNDEANVHIRGPVGIGSVRLQVRGDPNAPRLQLQTGNGVVLESDAAWSELEARLGANLPAGNLRYWLLGLAAPGKHHWSDPNEAGEVTLEQQGWRIDYQRYSNEFGARLPVRLRASNGDARVRIVIDRWRLGL